MMGTEQDNPKVVHKYESDDRQILVDLLHEYAEKLVDMSREMIIAGNQGKQKTSLSILLLIMTSICISYLFWCHAYAYTSAALETPKQYVEGGVVLRKMITERFLSNESIISILCTAFPLFYFMYSYLVVITKLRTSINLKNPQVIKIESDLREKDAQLIAGKLESVMRLTVEVTNQVETNLARKLELDLRLADASYALEYYHSVAGLKDKPNPNREKSLSNLFTLLRRFAFNQ
jgi:hypothetical protein